MKPCIETSIIESADEIAAQFYSAQPFKHVVLENFFREDVARSLVAEFPYAPENGVKNSYGAPGDKIVHSDLTNLGPTFREIDTYFSAQTTLDWLATITGIPDILYDPSNYGGGLHENCDNRDLRPHVDFNFHPVTKLHRRLNLIVYLNDPWKSDWGGSLQLYADPRNHQESPVSYEPLFNRCVLFATYEASWHGFDRLCFPKDGVYRSRKSLSLYFYTAERPSTDIYREHTTFFIPRPFPAKYAAGYTITREDECDLTDLIGQRDHLIELYQGEQGRQDESSSELAQLRILVSQLRKSQHVPTMGYVRTIETIKSGYSDGWCERAFSFRICAERPVSGISLSIRIPEGMPQDGQITVSIDKKDSVSSFVAPGTLTLDIAHTLETNTIAEISIRSTHTVNHYQLGISKDQRNLGFYLERVIFDHTG